MALSDNYPLVQVPGAQGLWHILSRSPGYSGDAWCHLVPGKDKAMLVDTGFGIGDLKGLVESLTALPVFVVNTHNHGDHVQGNPQFGKVYIHSMDAPGLDKQMAAPARALPPDEVRQYNYTQDDLIQPAPYAVETVEDGHVFDLGGGYEVEVFHLPGHAEGGIALLDRKRRALYSGDALVWTPTFCMSSDPDAIVTPYMTVEKFRQGLVRLMAHLDEFDVLYPGHSRLGISKQIVPDMLACCDELLSGDKSVAYRVPGRDKPVHVHGMARIAFDDNRIHVSQGVNP